MSGYVAVLLLLVALGVLALAAVIQIARRPAWSRLVLVALLTWASDRPQAKRSLRVRP